jgi:hypothetical protein
MLWALAKTSGRPLPIIIDTPLARLDSDHRKLLAQHYFPVASHQMLILSTDTEIAPEDAMALFRRMINKFQEHADEAPGEHHRLNSTEAVIPLLTAQPEDLVAMTSELKDLWMKGVYIGDPTVLFGTFRRVDPAQREQVRERLKAIYGEMKAAHPKLVDVDWSD